jgi:hypothetical protein
MVRKQVYLAVEQDRKLKRLASTRGCSEAEVIRAALDTVPDPDRDDVTSQLAAAGLLELPPLDPTIVSLAGTELRALEREFDAWFEQQVPEADATTPDPVISDREESEARLD